MTEGPLRVAVRRVGLARRAAARRFSLAARGALVSAVAAVLAIIALGLARTPVGLALAWAATVAFLATPALLVAARIAAISFRAARDASIAVDGDGVRVEDGRARLVARREDIASGIVVPRGNAWDVELEMKSGDVAQLRVADEAAAEGVLAALGHGAAQRRTTVRFGRLFQRIMMGFGTFTASVFLVMVVSRLLDGTLRVPNFTGLMSLCAYPLAALLIGPINRRLLWTEVTVGLDGLSVRAGLSRRFIPFADVVSADIYEAPVGGRAGTFVVPAGIELKKRDGRRERVPLDPDDPQLRDALLLRIRRALEARAQSGDTEATLELLAQRERAPAVWRRELAQLWRDPTYRDRVVRREDVARALDDAAATPSLRVGAAIALVASGDPEAPARVRIAADTCADQALREALVRIAAGEEDDAVIEAAVASEEGIEKPRRRERQGR